MTPHAALRWQLTARCPPGWERHLARTGGGFFHTPVGLLAGAPAGEPVFATLHARNHGGAVLGIAVGVRAGCRYSLGTRHVYFPTVPALAPSVDRRTALCPLVQLLRKEGAAEVQIDSFDAAWTPVSHTTNGRSRWEYVLPLSDDPDALVAGGSRTHRRYFRRGERDRWVLETVAGPAATRAVRCVHETAARRAARHGRAFEPIVPARAVRAALTSPGNGWGTSVFATQAGDDTLAAAVVGWANRRAFYVCGGSTPEGYRTGAAVWMHWRIAILLGKRGFSTYNLGGTPAGAADEHHSAHGLYRFKTGFGSSVHPCAGARWELSPLHLRAHRATQWFRGVVIHPRRLARTT